MAGNIEECLKTFIYHVRELGKEDEPGGDGFWREFRDLRELQVANKAENKFPAEEGKKETNIRKNRYKDILPFDSHRVSLKNNGAIGSDYINASFIEDVNRQRTYIAAQGPLPHTVNDFWRLLWEYEVEIVFMVCREEEGGRAKCHRYWTDTGQSKTFGDIEVTTESEETISQDFVKRTLCARCGNRTQSVKQFHYTGWPDHGVPRHSQEIYKMVGRMREERRLLKVPLVIHCSAGCGRTGTICAVDYAWTLLDQGKVQHGFSMFEIIKNIRQQRQSMVQTPDQYEFVHLVVQSLCEDWLEKFQEHDYANTPFHVPGVEDDDEVYYNTIGLTEDSEAGVYQEIKDVTPNPPARGLKKPAPTPRPPGLEVNNNEGKNSPRTTNYQNFALPTGSKRNSTSSVASSSKQTNRGSSSSVSSDSGKSEHNEKSSSLKSSVVARPIEKHSASKTSSAPSSVSDKHTAKPGHTTVIPLGAKQTEAHKIAVKNMAPPVPHTNHPTPGSIQQTAQFPKKRNPSNAEPAPTNNDVGQEYGVVKKDSSGKLTAAPYVPQGQGQLEVGQKKQDYMRNSQNFQGNYENIAPKKPATTYENFVPLHVTEKQSSNGPASTPEAESPGLPPRNYDPDEVSDDHPATVRAIGGLPPPQERVYEEIKHTTRDTPTSAGEDTTSSTNHTASSSKMNPFKGMMKKMVPGGRGRPNHVQNNNDGTKHMFGGRNIGFDNRVEKPKGTRQPANGVFMTRL